MIRNLMEWRRQAILLLFLLCIYHKYVVDEMKMITWHANYIKETTFCIWAISDAHIFRCQGNPKKYFSTSSQAVYFCAILIAKFPRTMLLILSAAFCILFAGLAKEKMKK